MKKVSLTLKPSKNALALAKKNISISRWKSDNKQKVTRSPDRFKVGDFEYVKMYSPLTWNFNWEFGLQVIQFLISYSAVLESTLNLISKDVNIHLVNPLTSWKLITFP